MKKLLVHNCQPSSCTRTSCTLPVGINLRRQEAVCSETSSSRNLGTTYLFPVSAIPAKALYQAKRAAMIPKAPPALIRLGSGTPVGRCK